MHESINYLKERLYHLGEKWKITKDREVMRDCLALVEAINALEERLYDSKITDITYVI